MNSPQEIQRAAPGMGIPKTASECCPTNLELCVVDLVLLGPQSGCVAVESCFPLEPAKPGADSLVIVANASALLNNNSLI